MEDELECLQLVRFSQWRYPGIAYTAVLSDTGIRFGSEKTGLGKLCTLS